MPVLFSVLVAVELVVVSAVEPAVAVEVGVADDVVRVGEAGPCLE